MATTKKRPKRQKLKPLTPEMMQRHYGELSFTMVRIASNFRDMIRLIEKEEMKRMVKLLEKAVTYVERVTRKQAVERGYKPRKAK